jgi:sec-independent protein translocase protein TatB
MFNIGGGEIMVILLLALLVLGPDKLPEATRKAGRYLNEFRRMTSGFQEEFRNAMDVTGMTSTTTDDDAVDRATDGPRLAPPPASPIAPGVVGPEPSGEAVDDAAGAGSPAGDEATAGTGPGASSAPTRSGPAHPGPAAFTADITPAPGTGPELLGPPGGSDAEAGGTSAA